MKHPATLNRLALALARLEPAGLSPRAPGTVASAVAALAAPWLFLPLSLPLRGLALAAIFLFGAWAAGRAEILLGRKDPGSVVIDELLGQWIALLPAGLIPAAEALVPGPRLAGFPALLLLLALALFRLFDIAKPGPVRAAETWLPGGWGVMLDDLVAGVFALAALTAFLLALSPAL